MITEIEFGTAFDTFRSTAYRLEALPIYTVDAEAEQLATFRAGLPRQARSVKTSPWLARIAATTASSLRPDGKQWARTRIMDTPLTEYQRFQLAAYVESQVVGDEIRVALRADVGEVGPDFWLFDHGTPGAFAIVMDYDDDGHWLGGDRVGDDATLAELAAVRARVDTVSVPLNTYLTSLGYGTVSGG